MKLYTQYINFCFIFSFYFLINPLSAVVKNILRLLDRKSYEQARAYHLIDVSVVR